MRWLGNEGPSSARQEGLVMFRRGESRSSSARLGKAGKVKLAPEALGWLRSLWQGRVWLGSRGKDSRSRHVHDRMGVAWRR